MTWRDWPYYLGAFGVVGVFGYFLRPKGEAAAPVAPLPDVGAAPRGRIDGDGPIVPIVGRTYFAALETSGAATAAASVERVHAKAEALGFRDVMVTEEIRPEHWPIGDHADADYYVRGTYRGAADVPLPREAGNWIGSVTVLDVVETL